MQVAKVSLQEGIYCMSKRKNNLIIVDRSTMFFIESLQYLCHVHVHIFVLCRIVHRG